VNCQETGSPKLSLPKKDDWGEVIGPGSELEVLVREPTTRHTVTLKQIQGRCDGVAVSPDEVIKRQTVRRLLST
jgi:hypothetical protein